MTRIELPREKTVQHLTLLRQPRTISGKEFNALSENERLTIICNADNFQRFRLLVEANDGRELIARLPAEEIFFLFKEVGQEAIEELLPMLKPDQFTACIDLDSWKQAQFDGESAILWLEALLEVDDDEAILNTIREMDFEVLVLLIHRHVTILSGPEAYDDDESELEAALSRNGGYNLSWNSERAAKTFGRLINILFNYDAGFYTYLMKAARAETLSMLEESVYTQRGDRLLDMGFPPPDEARTIHTWTDPTSFSVDERKRPMAGTHPELAAPTFMLTTSAPVGLLKTVLATGLNEADNWELAYLANKVLIADQVEIGEPKAMTLALTRLYSTLNLGLEYRCDGTDENPRDVFINTYFEHLFRLGYSLTLQLQRQAAKLARSVIGPWFEPADRALLAALQRRPHPLYFSGLENPQTTGERDFSSLADYRRAAARLDELNGLVQLFAKRPPFSLPDTTSPGPTGCVPAKTEITLSTLFLTALANRVLGRNFNPEPIPALELAGLHGKISRSGRIDSALRSETVERMEALSSGGGAFASQCLDRLEVEFCSVDPRRLDPRYVGGLIIRL
jgi:hypothetical protein